MQIFLRAGGDGAGGRAERKQECESVSGLMAEARSSHFLRRFDCLQWHKSAWTHGTCIGRTGLTARKVISLEHVPDCVFLASLLLISFSFLPLQKIYLGLAPSVPQNS